MPNPGGLGAPSKLTPARAEVILEYLSKGCPRATAAGAAGVSNGALSEWVRRGLDLDSARESDEVFAKFATQVIETEARWERETLEKLRRHVDEANDWRGSAWLLERRRPQHYGVRQEIAHTGDVSSRVVLVEPDVFAEKHRNKTQGESPTTEESAEE